MSASLVRAAAAGAVALLALTACTTGDDPDAAATPVVTTPTPSDEPDGDTVPDLTAESCREILSEVAGLDKAWSESLSNIAAAPEAFGRAADNIRAAATDAGAELSEAADDLAAAIDEIVDQVRAGDILGIDLDGSLTPAITQVFDVCQG